MEVSKPAIGVDSKEISLSDLENNVTNPKAVVRRFCKTADELKDYLLTKYPQGFTFDNVTDVIVEAIQYLALYKKLTGAQKRKIIVESILLVLDETDSGNLETFEPILKAMVPATVDTLIAVEKKKIKLNKKNTTSLLKCLCCCC